MSKTFEELVTAAYVGEVWGERMLDRILEAGTFPAEREQLQLLLALEARTRGSLEAVVKAEGFDADAEAAREEADDYALKLADSGDWDAFMRETLEIATAALPEFEQLRDVGPQRFHSALVETVEHEQAVIAYARARLDGDLRGAHSAVAGHLASWT